MMTTGTRKRPAAAASHVVRQRPAAAVGHVVRQRPATVHGRVAVGDKDASAAVRRRRAGKGPGPQTARARVLVVVKWDSRIFSYAAKRYRSDRNIVGTFEAQASCSKLVV
eukprot:2710834-Amphidinium_carterae.1